MLVDYCSSWAMQSIIFVDILFCSGQQGEFPIADSRTKTG